MKRIIFILIFAVLTIGLSAQQNKFTYPLYLGKTGLTTGKTYYYGITSGMIEVKAAAAAGTGTVFQFPANNGTNGYVLTTDGNGVTSWAVAAASMIYPGAGIPVSTGTGWGTSSAATLPTSGLLVNNQAFRTKIDSLLAGATPALAIADTADMLDTYINNTELNDRFDAELAGAELAVALADSANGGGATLTYVTGKDHKTDMALKLSKADLPDSLFARDGVYNIKDYGAVGNGTHDDTEAIQDAIDAAMLDGDGNTLYIPKGVYMITDTLTISRNGTATAGFKILGNGYGSVIYNNGTTPTITFRDINWPQVENIYLMGNGGSYGAGATGKYAIELDNSSYGSFKNIFIRYNGGGILYYNGIWGNRFENMVVNHNLLDGLNAVSNSAQQNTGANGHATSIINSSFSINGNDGIEWSASGFSITGSAIELNKGSGIQIGSTKSTSNALGAEIVGCYFEGNDSSQIKLIAVDGIHKIVSGVIIEGNYIMASNTVGDTYAIRQEVPNGTYNNSFRNSRIGKNYFYRTGGYVTKDIYIESGQNDVEIEYPEYQVAGMITIEENAYPTIIDQGQKNPQPKYVTLDVTGVTSDLQYPILSVDLAGNVDITTNPQIADGLFNGQVITLIIENGTYTLTLEDANGLQLAGGASFAMGRGDVISLMYISTLDIWIELFRSDN